MDPHRLGEERSLALHARIAELLRDDPRLVEAASARVEEWARTGAVSRPYVDAWRSILSLPIDQLCLKLVDESQTARDLRQTTPFAGTLSPRERWRIRREVASRLKDGP